MADLRVGLQQRRPTRPEEALRFANGYVVRVAQTAVDSQKVIRPTIRPFTQHERRVIQNRKPTVRKNNKDETALTLLWVVSAVPQSEGATERTTLCANRRGHVCCRPTGGRTGKKHDRGTLSASENQNKKPSPTPLFSGRCSRAIRVIFLAYRFGKWKRLQRKSFG